MSFSNNNKVVIVTGASSGIGAATALMFAKDGARVVLVARTQAKLEAVAQNIAELGRKYLIIQADLSKEEDVATIVPKTIKHFGKLDVLVNNAGMVTEGSLMDGKVLKAYDEIMRVNVRSAIQLTSLAAPHLAKTGGNVINISSAVSLRPSKNPELLPYHVSKAALDHFTRCAAMELASSGVRVNTVNPGPVDNDFISNNNLGDPEKLRQVVTDATVQGFIATSEEIGSVILFLASDKAKSVTGSNYVMDNGWSMKN